MSIVDKVYLVTAGEYSDYRVKAAFTTRESAEAYIDLSKNGHLFFGSDAMRIEPYPLDQPSDLWGTAQVRMDKQGNVLSAVRTSVDACAPFIDNQGNMVVVIEGGDIERAIKVANEARTQWLASGRPWQGVRWVGPG